jgi:transcriptional regulator with GAF, ATPase, and Fis domain
MATVSPARLATIFVEVADTLGDGSDLIDFLQMVADRAAQLVDAAVGLLLADSRGELQFMAASEETVRLLELFQLENREGPCLDAFRTAEPVAGVDLARPGGAWPGFCVEAASVGFASVHAFPLRHGTEVLGAMNVFGRATGGFGAADAQILQSLADFATIAILKERAISRCGLLAEQLQAALSSRIVIEQAKGALAQVHDVSVDTAFNLIRSYARSRNRRLTEVAQAVVSNLASMPELAKSADQRREE